MALGKRSSKEFLPVMKFDARNGTFSLIERVQAVGGEWQSVASKIEPEDFRAIPALDDLEVGWLGFTTGKPDVVMVAAGSDVPARWGDPPSDHHKLGIRLLWKMASDLGGGIREMMGTSIGLWNGVDRLHDDYMAAAPDHPGQLPIVGVTEVVEKKTPNGSSFEPCFVIIGWKDRPTDLPNTPPTFSRVSETSKSTASAKPAAAAMPTASVKPSRDVKHQGGVKDAVLAQSGESEFWRYMPDEEEGPLADPDREF
jgi:hypothetical protein